MGKKKRQGRPPGTIRQSQLITSFGPGSMMDLPDHSVLIGGLDHWDGDKADVVEPRLLEKLKKALDLQELRMCSPPADHGDPTRPLNGIVAWQFPEWFITQHASAESDQAKRIRSRQLVHRDALTRGRFVDRNKKRQTVVPIRFIRACKHGHIGDIDWYAFVHEDYKSSCRRSLWVDELDTSGDISSIQIRCECGKRRPLKEAVGYVSKALGKCDGARPWLGPASREQCDQLNRLLIRTASNAYFSQKLSVISLPKRNETISNAVDQVWAFIEAAESVDELKIYRKMAQVKAVVEDFTDDEIWGEVVARRNGDGSNTKSVKQAELETLIAAKDELGNDKPDGDFYARALPRKIWDKPWMDGIERIVLVHRLREVVAQLGFTRFEPAAPDIEGELEIGVVRAPLAREVTWLPAVENRGEGVFIQFKSEAVEEWVARKDVTGYKDKLLEGFNVWKAEHSGSNRDFPGLPFLMLHSFSHLLLTSLSLECGYPASSIKERIYSIGTTGYGVMLYTGSPDAEGTLGGLVQTGRSIHEHIKRALEYGELCSNDPVCAGHDPKDPHERRFLHGAACHGCLLISETSCEQFNSYLDRSLVVPTLENVGVEFFKGFE